MNHVFAGPPYFYLCRKCSHRFSLMVKLGLICPKCHSLDVIADPFVVK
ncbi:MAG: zinc ribbon domain-containing protein [Proteobacteria bacterium]|nr:zinc ribbon domain-containing protein [Pseudomonadota bacterium]